MTKLIILSTTPSLFPDLESENHALSKTFASTGIGHQVHNWYDLYQELPTLDLTGYTLLFRTVWDYPQYYEDFINFLGILESNSIPTINPIEVIKWNIHKSYLLELQEAGLPVVPVQFISKGTILENLSCEYVLKPAIGLGAIGAQRIYPDSSIYVETDSLLTPYRKNISEGELSIIIVNHTPELFIKKIPSETDWRVQPQYGGSYIIENTAPEQAISIAKQLFQYIHSKFSNPYFLYMRIDLILNDEKEWEILEFEAIDPSLYGAISPKAIKKLALTIHDLIN